MTYPNDDDYCCPLCSSQVLGHQWRMDMPRMLIIDDWTCLSCRHRWTETLTFEQMRQS